MAFYAEQVLICTGKKDWKSRIEDEDDAMLLRQLKGLLTRGGKYADVRAFQSDIRCILGADFSIAVPQCAVDKRLVPCYEIAI